jgi:hypothetical protein
MMGVLAESRGKLLGIPLGVLFGGMLIVNILGTFALFTPWSMAFVLPAALLEVPLPLPVGLPLLATATLTLVSIAVALWELERLEF